MSLLKARVHAKLLPTQVELRTPSASISGLLFLQIGDEYFPSREWHDMTSYLLGKWLQAAMSVTRSREATSEFMDGPYFFGLRLRDDKITATMTLYEERGSPEKEYVIDFPRYLASLRGATKDALNQATSLGVGSRREFEDLATWLRQFIGFEDKLRKQG